MAEPIVDRWSARLSAKAARGWNDLRRSASGGAPSFSGLCEALGVYLHEHDGRLWMLTEAQCRKVIEAAFEIDYERRVRGERPETTER